MNQDRETRDRLLKAACALFSDRGFKKVTVREICLAAQANVAAVNYHFGDKLGLYRELLQQAIDGMRAVTESARNAGEGRPAEEKLRRYLVIFLHHVLKPEHAVLHRLLQREMLDPTPMLDTLVEQGVRPRVEYLAGVIAEMVGSTPTDPRVLRCVGSVQSQPLMYLPNPIAAKLGFGFKGTPAEIDTAARHIVEFSVGGIRAIGREQPGRSEKPVLRSGH
jgi:AcrR family transcriptional regulator